MRQRIGLRRKTNLRGRCAGFTLIETLIAMSLVAVALAGIISAYVSGIWLRQVNMEKAKARNAAEQTFSAIRGMENIVDAYLRFGGGALEETFEIRGLQGPAANEPPGRIIVWRLKSSLKNRVTPPKPDPASSLALSQIEILGAQAAFSSSFPSVIDTVANMTGSTAWDDYIDTNNDGVVDDKDEPQIMPVTIRIRWRSRSGMSTHYFSATIGRR